VKIVVESELVTCDLCGNKLGRRRGCRVCGQDICTTCIRNKKAKRYDEYVLGDEASESVVGLYCNDCDKLMTGGQDPIHEAFAAVERLQREHKLWQESFINHCIAAESKLQKLLEQAK
jgi:hypothetical protein